MKDTKMFKDVVRQHESAKRVFSSSYSFKTKQNDILYYIESSIRKYQAEQLSDQEKVEALNKKMNKQQIKIDNLITQLEITKSVTELDITDDGV